MTPAPSNSPYSKKTIDMKLTQNIFLSLLLLALPAILLAQKLDNERLKKIVATYKADLRGPYKDIRWFCKDGSVLPPKEKCPQPGGVQRARYKDEVAALGKEYHLYLGQILSTTAREDFWDAANYNSRIKQYQLGKYLQAVDDGWILRKAQFYRGAFQVEDEENWGKDFLQWLLAQVQLGVHLDRLRRAALVVQDAERGLEAQAVEGQALAAGIWRGRGGHVTSSRNRARSASGAGRRRRAACCR